MTTYIKLSTGEFPRHIGDIEIDPSGISDYAIVTSVEPPEIDINLQKCFSGPPQQINGIWYQTWIVQDLTPEDLEQRKNFLDQQKNNKFNLRL
jgi:hypothetical protein